MPNFKVLVDMVTAPGVRHTNTQTHKHTHTHKQTTAQWLKIDFSHFYVYYDFACEDGF